MGLRTRRKVLILEGKEKRDFGWLLLFTEKMVQYPGDASRTS